jgi:hypothetical protein
MAQCTDTYGDGLVISGVWVGCAYHAPFHCDEKAFPKDLKGSLPYFRKLRENKYRVTLRLQPTNYEIFICNKAQVSKLLMLEKF